MKDASQREKHMLIFLLEWGGGLEREGKNLREKPAFSNSCLDPDKLTLFSLS